MQPVAAISFISAALFVHPKVSGRKVTREVWGKERWSRHRW
jgi:hypothetical protein